MSNNNDISVQISSSTSYTLQHPDGSAVTAQEVYDAFMSGLVILSGSGIEALVISLEWLDANAGTDDPTNVVWVEVKTNASLTIEVGTYPDNVSS